MQTANTSPALQKALKKKKQGRLAFYLLLFNLLVVIFLVYKHHLLLAVSWLFGIGFGVVLQRSRFCLAAAFRDLFITSDTSLARALVISLLVSTVGFSLIIYFKLGSGSLAGLRIRPFGVHTAVGATLFGIGMVLAGGCASGTLWRMGEGYMLQWVVFAGFLTGSFFGTWHYDWWQEKYIKFSPALFLPEVLGWPLAVAAQLTILAFLYLLFWRVECHRRGGKKHE